jgi:hypothetical protein
VLHYRIYLLAGDLIIILRVYATEVAVEIEEDESVDKDSKDTGLTAHEYATGASGEGQEEAWAEDDEEDDGKEHFGDFLHRNREN